MGTELRPHILRMHGDAAASGVLTHARGRQLFRGQTEVGRTEHVVVFSDGSAEGNATAQAILQTAEADYQATQAWFGGIDLPPGQEGDDQTSPRTATPVQVLMDPQAGGAYHFGCDATDLYTEPTPELGSGFFVAELVEVFEAAIANGWDCGRTNGEGLSRVLAALRTPNLGGLLVQTGQSWWANGHQDYITSNNADDRDQDSNGCATLFLFYLHGQLGFPWTQIVTTGGGTLGETYTRLTGQSAADGFNDFVGRLSVLDMGGFLSLPPAGNPFPISSVAAVPAPAAPAVVHEPASAPASTDAAPLPIQTDESQWYQIPEAVPLDAAAAPAILADVIIAEQTPAGVVAAEELIVMPADAIVPEAVAPAAPEVPPEPMPEIPAQPMPVVVTPAEEAPVTVEAAEPVHAAAPAAPAPAATAAPIAPIAPIAPATTPAPAAPAPAVSTPAVPVPAVTAQPSEARKGGLSSNALIGVVLVLILLVALALIGVLFLSGVFHF